MQPVDAAHADHALDLGEADGRHGVVDVGVAFGEVEGDDGGGVEVVLGQVVEGALAAGRVACVFLGREGRVGADAVGEGAVWLGGLWRHFWRDLFEWGE